MFRTISLSFHHITTYHTTLPTFLLPPIRYLDRLLMVGNPDPTLSLSLFCLVSSLFSLFAFLSATRLNRSQRHTEERSGSNDSFRFRNVSSAYHAK
ncbi:hypothetical protein BCR39DRAFT_531676 [Naematelia encephala]|uniref:Uncharacterized protein n=1 Tax=Naematelia encephala TaxID=71784 RepID=A0A1Y2B435_9TREE|nr:hypothetical protein BCR39DRAFT_531676 [Naematelia encephala]